MSYQLLIPHRTVEALKRHAETGGAVGGFVNAVLENNLAEAFGRADSLNKSSLEHIVSYLHNDMPSDSWGSPAKVEAWRKAKGTL